METINNLVTADRLMYLQGDGYRCELIRGEVVRMSPTGGKRGVMGHRIGRLLGNWAEQQGIGLVFAAETGFKLATNPDTVRGRCRLRAKRAHPRCGRTRQLLGRCSRLGGGSALAQ